jgi:transcriptional regulator with XRE-family HTH domain
MNSLKQVGLNVRRLRTARALSQEALALDAGIAINYLSGIERGARNPTVLVLDRLAAALRVSLADLVAPSTRDAPAKNLRPGKRPSAKK